jgi:hypothetical protein
MSTLLSFHKKIFEKIHDPSTSDLVILARGLGLRRIICTLMKIYDSPQNLVLLVNATAEEESAIGEELGILGCRKPGLRVVGYEIGNKDRCILSYMSFFSVLINCVKTRFVQTGRDNVCYISNSGCRHVEGRYTDRTNNWYACYARGKVSWLNGLLIAYDIHQSHAE